MRGTEKLGRFFRYLCLGVVVMVLVLVSAAAMKRLGVSGESLAELEAPVQDFLMRFVRPGGDPHFPPILFIDVDEATWRDPAWGGGEPRAVPLKPLAGLLAGAVEQGATYILADFVVDGGPEEEMESFYRQVRETVDNAPDRHFLFVRGVRDPLEGGETPPTIRPSHALDRLMGEFPDRVHAVSTNFIETDQVVRHWRLWESAVFQVPGRPGEGERDFWTVLPSPQLLIHALELERVRAGGRPAAAAAVRRSLDFMARTGKRPPLFPTPEGLLAGSAGVATEDAPPDPAEDARGKTRADFAAGNWIRDVFGRCYYQDEFTEADCRADAPDFGRQATDGLRHHQANRVFFSWGEGETPRKGLYRVPARAFLHANAAQTADPEERLKWFRSHAASGNGIAIVGASYEASRDFHITPRGKMPGALLVANAVATMALHGPMQELGFRQNAVMLLGMVILFSAAFAWAPGRRWFVRCGRKLDRWGWGIARWGEGKFRLVSQLAEKTGDMTRRFARTAAKPPFALLPAAVLVILFFLPLTGALLVWGKTWFNFTLTMSFIWILLKMRDGKLWLVSGALLLVLLFMR